MKKYLSEQQVEVLTEGAIRASGKGGQTREQLENVVSAVNEMVIQGNLARLLLDGSVKAFWDDNKGLVLMHPDHT